MEVLSRDQICSMYLEQLPYEPYAVQEEALLAWYTTQEGVLVCAPTGTGKTLIAEAALFEALHTGMAAYYTTPLIALTEQKFREIQDSAVRWGFDPNDVGLVTGNRKVNPDAKVLVVVAEILLNRLLNADQFEFSSVSAVVMDEFHSFNDPERGIVWELSLGMLPKHVRLLLLSATVGNTAEFMIWLNKSHGRRLDLVQGTERKVPLRFHWVDDQLLNEQLERMATGDDETRKTPTLLFCFNRDECWRVAEQLKGKSLLSGDQQKQLASEIKKYDWSQGVGPKLKTILLRGVGVHHAGVLPKYKRIVENLFQRKLLTVCVCTETLSAGMNLPARSVLMTTLLKGPPGKKKLIDPSVAHQIFGRAGRPQYDDEGHVFALSHEDDVKIARHQMKIDQIPEDTRDPQLIKKRKQLKKKAPTRRTTEQYWNETQFNKLIEAPPTNLRSQGQIPWRLLAYLLSISPDVSRVRAAIRKRLMDEPRIKKALVGLTGMLTTLEDAGFVKLEPPRPISLADDNAVSNPSSKMALFEQIEERALLGEFESTTSWKDHFAPAEKSEAAAGPRGQAKPDDDGFGFGLDESSSDTGTAESEKPRVTIRERRHANQGQSSRPRAESDVVDASTNNPEPSSTSDDSSNGISKAPDPKTPAKLTTSLKALLEAQGIQVQTETQDSGQSPKLIQKGVAVVEPIYEPERAYPNESLADLLTFKSINPIYGLFLSRVLPYCDPAERIQAMESVLVCPVAIAKSLRIPRSDILPPSPFTNAFLDPELLQRGVASPAELGAQLPRDEQRESDSFDDDEWVRPLNFPEKLLRLFRSEYPKVDEIQITDVWVAGELMNFRGDFNKLITSRKLAKQEGIVFRHILRFILLCDEFLPHVAENSDWFEEINELCELLTASCRAIDAQSTDSMIESAQKVDPLLAERS